MSDLKKTENYYRKFMKDLKESEVNPYEGEIEELEHELNDPLVKYDKARRNEYLKHIDSLKAKF
jgi:hypothetical protein